MLEEYKNYVSRGSLKLKYAIENFKINVEDKIAADLGSSTGGFVEVLLEKGASKVYAIDTALVIDELLEMGIKVDKCLKSPISGGKGQNTEYLILINKDEKK
ncbi:MAG: SAM-dependent methyltransferase [Patescibacteria group bacterium]|nr:SAM-dependent methyltransferase [Patescibacteria group bacterium]MDD4610505.1 SAM-dependent methyltransferase [Patescibacteria group bacterium]